MFKWLDLFRKGEMVANPVAWKTGQITVAVLTPLILGSCSLLKLAGFEIPIDEALANQIALAIIAISTIVLTLTTSDKVGVLPAKSEIPASPKQSNDPTDSARKILGGQ